MRRENSVLRFDIWGITASLDDPRIAQLTDSERRELRGDQVSAIFKLTPISVVANLANMITLNLLFDQPANSLFFTLWNLALGTVLIRWIFVWRARGRFCEPNGASERAVKRLTFNSILFAIIWAAPIIYLFGSSDIELRAILMGVAIGMVTGGALTLATVWQAALCFVITLLIPAGATIVMSGFLHAAAVLTFGISFLMVVASVVLDRSSLFFDARRSAIHLQKLNRIRVDQLRDLQESSDDILWEVDAHGRLIHVNDRLAQIFRRSIADIEGMSLQVLFGRRPEDPFRVTNNASNRYIRACMRQRKSIDRCTITVNINKEIRCWAVSAKVSFAEDGSYLGFRGLVCDVTETLRAQAATELLAMTDPLTGLPNRLFLQNQVELAFKNIASENDGFTLVTLDLDRFKQINDTFGHAVGDELLRQCSDRLTAALRSDEIVTRYGGDEFVLLLRTTNHESLQEISSRLIRTISAPYRVDRHLLNVGASIGIALAPHDATTFKELLRKSDQALYRAKSEGRGRYCLFSRELSSTIAKRRQTEADLREAIATSQILLNFQPIVEMQTGRIVACETLVRWEHPERGAISPIEFINIAEETGLIVELGAWILDTACTQALAWPRDVRVAVNVSAVQFRCHNFTEQVQRALRDSGLPASRLDIEITESVLITDRAQTLRTLNELRELGVRISLDDFGTGYSSLAYLSEFPIDKIKIDQSFVRKLGHQSVSSAIVRAITDLGNALGIATIAEGVETTQQLELLRDQGCTQAQGYLISRPVPASQIAFLLGNPNAAFISATKSATPPETTTATVKHVA